MEVLLVVLIALVVLTIPTIPMLVEWRRATDAEPLPILQAEPIERHREAIAFGEGLRANIAGVVESYIQGGVASERSRDALREQVEIVGPEGPSDVDLTIAGKPAVMVNYRMRVLSEGKKIFRPTYVTGDFRAMRGTAINKVYVDGSMSIDEDVWVASWVHSNGAMSIGAGARLNGSASARKGMQVDPGVTFERLEAPEIRFGDAWHWKDGPPPMTGEGPLPLFRLNGRAYRLGEGISVPGGLVIPPDHQFAGDLVVHGSLRIGRGAIVTGHVKAHGDIKVHPEARINGHLFADGSIDLAAGVVVMGSVIAQQDLRLRWGSEVGVIDLPATVSGSRLLIDQGTRVFGVVHATAEGRVGTRNHAARAA